MSNTLPPNFDQQLIAAQGVDETLQQKYEREVRAMFEKELTTRNKVLYGFIGVLSVALAIMFAVFAIKSAGLPWEARLGFVLGVVFSGAFFRISSMYS